VIQSDLTKERPIYPLSCYGPGKDAPRQLIEGPVEISPEELRFRYYTLRAAGNEPTAVSLEFDSSFLESNIL
jgi:nucleoporin NUP42